MRYYSQFQNSETASERLGHFSQGPAVKERAFSMQVSINLCPVIPVILKLTMRVCGPILRGLNSPFKNFEILYFYFQDNIKKLIKAYLG